MSMNPELLIRPSTADDVPLILDFIRSLAEYEKLSPEVAATEADIRESLFGAHPASECALAFREGRPAGFAVFFHNFSTFLGRRGLYLEDLFVKPEFRGRGIGRALFIHVAGIANDRGCARFEWSVLDWNRPAIDFYMKFGAKPMDEWTVFRLAGKELEDLNRRLEGGKREE
jgi:GNAT superfamily N-acetyltransferase